MQEIHDGFFTLEDELLHFPFQNRMKSVVISIFCFLKNSRNEEHPFQLLFESDLRKLTKQNFRQRHLIQEY